MRGRRMWIILAAAAASCMAGEVAAVPSENSRAPSAIISHHAASGGYPGCGFRGVPCAFSRPIVHQSSSSSFGQKSSLSRRRSQHLALVPTAETPPLFSRGSHMINRSTSHLFMNTPIANEASSENKSTTSSPSSSAPKYPLVILIGGSGFLGSEIRQQLQDRGVECIATSTPATAKKNNEFVPLDLTAKDAEEQFFQLVNKSMKESNANKVAVISAMGSIGTDQDEEVNSALARAIRGAHRTNTLDGDNEDNTEGVLVERFVMIGNTERVRRLARNVSFLKGYASGKDEAESALKDCFGSNGCIIKPSFIYGGDDISLNPPRLPKSLGGLASEILGLYPIQALADELPDALALPLAPPVSVEMVAAAAVNVALGIVEGYTDELAGEAINMAGSTRGWKEKTRYDNWLLDAEEEGVVYDGQSKDSCDIDAITETNEERRWKRIGVLKQKLLHEGDGGVDDLAIMEELECLRPQSMKPAYDPKLNGQWNFVLSKDDLGTQLIKELLPPDYFPGDGNENSETSPLKALLDNLYQLQGLYMRIHDEQSQVEIVLSSNVCFGKIPIDIVFATSLLSTNYDEETEGTLFLEKFEAVIIGGVSLPLPSSWQRFRYLEITFLDEEIVIARGSGGEPHVLVRAADKDGNTE